jgi:hypothetical protein
MTKPTRATSRADDWTFHMPAGRATHVPTGLEFELVPAPGGRIPGSRLAAGYREMGGCILPPGVKDRRPPGAVPEGDPNGPDVDRWAVLAKSEALVAAQDLLAQQHGVDQARQMLPALARAAAERWLFRARLERGWTNGQRAT